MAAADRAVTGLGAPPVYPVRSVRDLPDCLVVTPPEQTPGSAASVSDGDWAEAVRAAVREEVGVLDAEVGAGGGRIAVITPDAPNVARVLGADRELAAAMEAPGGDVLRSRVAVMGPVLSKGLEFDVVVLLDPARIGAVSPGDLYVAMTRPTRRLRVLSREALPAGLRARSRTGSRGPERDATES